MKTNNVSVNHITPSKLAEALQCALSIGLVPMVWSSPGLGKSAIISKELLQHFLGIATAIFIKRGLKTAALNGVSPKVFERRCGDHDVLDFNGLPYVKDGVQRRAVSDIWPGVGAGEDKVYGILFLDEFTQAGREKQTVVQQLFDTGRIGDYVLPGHPKSDPECKLGLVLIVLAGNRQSDRANSHGMGVQTGNRVAHFTLEANEGDWLEWGAANDIDPLVLAFIRQQPQYICKGLDTVQKGEHPTGSTPRSLERLSDAVKTCPSPDIETVLYNGIVGEECSRAFIALAHASRCVDVEQVLAGQPDDAEIPKEVGHQFAAASLLIRRGNEHNVDHIIRYLERVGDGGFSSPEVAVFVVEAIKRRVPLVAETEAYRDFCLKWAAIRS